MDVVGGEPQERPRNGPPPIGERPALVSRRIVREVRRLPDALRTDKTAFKQIVESRPTGVPIATRTAAAWDDKGALERFAAAWRRAWSTSTWRMARAATATK